MGECLKGENAPEWLMLEDGYRVTHEERIVCNLKEPSVSPGAAKGHIEPPPGYMTTYRAAQELKLSINTVYAWASRGLVPSIRIDRFWLVRIEDVKVRLAITRETETEAKQKADKARNALSESYQQERRKREATALIVAKLKLSRKPNKTYPGTA